MTYEDLKDALLDAHDILDDHDYTDTAEKVDWAYQYIVANSDHIRELLEDDDG